MFVNLMIPWLTSVNLNPHPGALSVIVQIVPLQSIMQEFDKCLILNKGTVWRGITDIYHMLPMVGHYTREI